MDDRQRVRGAPDDTDPLAYFAFNRASAWADPFLWAPLQITGSVGMLLGERWGFLLALMASVPFWYTAVFFYFWDRNLGFRLNTVAYWILTWGMWPVSVSSRVSTASFGSSNDEQERSPTMSVLWGVIVVLLSLLSWGGQALSLLAPASAVRWKLMEAEDDVEPTFWADARAEALWDTLTLWMMVVAGALLIADVNVWAYFGLVGGGMYLYFGGRAILARATMASRGLRIGSPQNVRLGYVFSTVWTSMALVTIAAAIVSIES